MSSTALAAPPDPSRELRRTAADAIERIRALPLSPPVAAVVVEVAAIALGALSAALFTDTDREATGRLLAPLVAGDLGRIADLLGVALPSATAGGSTALVCAGPGPAVAALVASGPGTGPAAGPRGSKP